MLMITAILAWVLAGGFAIALRIFAALAVNYDARSRNLKITTLCTVLTALFPVAGGILYLCLRTGAEPNEKECTNCRLRMDGSASVCPNCQCSSFATVLSLQAPLFAQKAKNCMVGAVVCLVLPSMLVGIGGFTDLKDVFTGEKETTTVTQEATEPESTTASADSAHACYDREGNAYNSADEVLFYAEDGETFTYYHDDDTFEIYFISQKDGARLPQAKCFVDKDGYFVYDEKGAFTRTDSLIVFQDADGNEYMPAALAMWDKDGNLKGTFGVDDD